MTAIQYLRSFEFIENTILIQLIVFDLVCALLTGAEEEVGRNKSFHKNASESFLNYTSQKEEKLFNNTNKLICFYVFDKKINPRIMDDLCTHINVGFFGISKKSNKLKVSNDQEQILSKVLLLKEKSKELKIIISVGGMGEMGFSSMVLNHKSRKIFIKSCMEFIKKFKIDGIDLDWEWPVVMNGNEKEKIKFVQLLQEIRREFSLHNKNYILSIDVPSAKAVIELGYFVQYIANYVDYVNVMCYDYHYFTKLYPFTGANAPMYSSSNDIFFKSNINYSINYWISNSMPREKIVLGMPTYGHTYELIFPDQHSLFSPSRGFGSVGKNGFAGYQEICQFLKNPKTTVVYDTVSRTPYAYHFPEWISFDDEKSLSIKASYILEEKLAGAMIFSVNSDDFIGVCKENRIPLPLIKKVRNLLFNEL